MTRLIGRVVATTRDGDPGDRLVVGLRAEGCRVLVWPTLSFAVSRNPEALRSAISSVAAYHWLVFTSARGVAVVTEVLTEVPAGVRVAAVGPSTAEALRARGWPVTTAGDGGAEALVRRIAADFDLDGARVLFPAASRARPTLETALRLRGARVDRVEAYHTRHDPPDRALVARDLADGVDAVTFTSPSALRSLSSALGPDWLDALASCAVVTIGDTTAAAARQSGLVDVTTAPEATLPGLIEGCALALRRGRPT
jgi:uroporphyrinogen III methyltransferase/synthase